MTDPTVRELAACLTYARAVAHALPIDDAADAAIARAMAARPPGPYRKLTRKAQP